MVFTKLWGGYINSLNKNPFVTQCLTSGVLMSIGDIISQTVIEDRSKKTQVLDLARLGRMAAIGTFVNGPMLATWYKFLDTRFTSVGTKLILDQGAFAPVIISTFFGINGAIQGQSPQQVVEKIKSDLPTTLLTNWTVWPAAMFISFKFVPSNQRVLFSSTVALFWNVYLSTVGNRPKPEEIKQ